MNLELARVEVQNALMQWRLPLRTQRWRGVVGGMRGHGTGSSLDFEDHRAYAPGDDLRHLDWGAMARTGNPLMKVFRKEVRLDVDLAVDGSASMEVGEGKMERVMQLVWWCVGAAQEEAASVRIWLGTERGCMPLEEEELRDKLQFGRCGDAGGSWVREVAWRSGALRIWISDLLWPGDPEGILDVLLRGAGKVLVLVPYTAEEVAPDWGGNVEFEDVESGKRDFRNVDASIKERYLKAYEAHFEMWRIACERRAICLARIPAGGELAEILREHAAPLGAADWVGG